VHHTAVSVATRASARQSARFIGSPCSADFSQAPQETTLPRRGPQRSSRWSAQKWLQLLCPEDTFSSMPAAPTPAESPNWRHRIICDPAVPSGPPILRASGIAVTDVLQRFAVGVSGEELLRQFPGLCPEDIRACLTYAAEVAIATVAPPAPAEVIPL